MNFVDTPRLKQDGLRINSPYHYVAMTRAIFRLVIPSIEATEVIRRMKKRLLEEN